jgi:RNA polymerase sigma-70 factor (ECF subfamily)
VGYLPEPRLPDALAPLAALERGLGFVPELFRAQALLPRLIEAEAGIAEAVLLRDGALSRVEKERLLLAAACAEGNVYCATIHSHLLATLGVPAATVEAWRADYHQATLAPAEAALLDFALKLTRLPTWVGGEDIERLRQHGYSDAAVLDAVLVTGLASFLGTLSTGLGVAPDFEPVALAAPVAPAAEAQRPSAGFAGEPDAAPRYIEAPELAPDSFPPFAFFKARFGFVPNIFRSQTLRPGVLAAEAQALDTVLLSNDVLSRVRKEYVLLAVSAANLNTYCVAVHVEMLRHLGVPEDRSDQIAIDHRASDLPEADKALLDCAVTLARQPRAFSAEPIETLRRGGFDDRQILEALAMTALSMFLNTVQMGLGAVPDFEPERIFPRATVNPFAASAHQTARAGVSKDVGGEDPDATLVSAAQAGDLSAFEELVRRHHQRVYRTVIGISGHPDDAEDDVQNVFVKLFRNLGKFRGDSRFSTWLTRIAINEGLERVRRGRPTESIEVDDDEEAPYRPIQVQMWVEDTEQVFSRVEVRALVEQAILALPEKYRAVVVLRDIEQLTTEETAAALGLGTATMKTRLLRGRLLLREALAPHFIDRSRSTGA